MKLHTKLNMHDIYHALWEVKQRGQVTDDIEFVQFADEHSRTHNAGYLIQLGTYDQLSLPSGKKRHFKNSGDHGAGSVWAATYDEWGWFIAEIFELDPDAKFGYYADYNDFHEKTKGAFQ